MVVCVIRVWTCLAVLLALVPLQVAAQAAQEGEPQRAEPAEYRGLINAALDEYEAHNFVEARALFMQAHAASPSARTLRGLGMAEFELKNYTDSVRNLEAALASTVKRLEGDLRQQTEELLARARRFVARFALQITPGGVTGLTFVLDREPVTLGPELTLTLPVGDHVLLVSAPGYAEEKRTLSVKGAEERALPIQLRLVSDGSTALAPAQPRKDEKPLVKNPWLWSGVGAVVLGGIVAAVVLSLDKDEKGPKPDVSVQTLARSR
jgi:hypothetical protein